MLNHCIAVTLILSTLLIASTQSADDVEVKLLSYENSPPMKDGYKFKYETSDGSLREETGVIMNPGTPEEELVVSGRYSYKSGEDEVMVMYKADKNGYRPMVRLVKKMVKKMHAIKSLVG